MFGTKECEVCGPWETPDYDTREYEGREPTEQEIREVWATEVVDHLMAQLRGGHCTTPYCGQCDTEHRMRRYYDGDIEGVNCEDNAMNVSYLEMVAKCTCGRMAVSA